jgi:hypothetical protein
MFFFDEAKTSFSKYFLWLLCEYTYEKAGGIQTGIGFSGEMA